MRPSFLATVVVLICAQICQSINDYPIVLVYGLFGWGRSEIGGIKYWGGFHGDTQEDLRKEGYKVYTAEVGSISSNWDRACELYAQIKGGTVDYGKYHSEKHGHSRYGKTYPGFYKEWGTLDENGNLRKIHLIGHSMGGPTARVLAQLLANGTQNAPVVEVASQENYSALFEGGHGDWIHSITTFASPHKGSLIADGFHSIRKVFLAGLSSFIGICGLGGDLSNRFYDFKLSQWNISSMQPGEKLTSYVQRILSSELFSVTSKDTALYDLTTKGAAEINSWAIDQPHIYYYSYSNADTVKFIQVKNWKIYSVQIPHVLTMLLPLQPTSYILGGTFPLEANLGEAWQRNDGMVSKISMIPGDHSLDFRNNTHQPSGTWISMPHLDYMDHMAVTGFSILKEVKSLYINHAKLLKNHPTTSQMRRLTVQSHNVDKDLVNTVQEGIDSWREASLNISSVESIKERCLTMKQGPGRAYCFSLVNGSSNLLDP